MSAEHFRGMLAEAPCPEKQSRCLQQCSCETRDIASTCPHERPVCSRSILGAFSVRSYRVAHTRPVAGGLVRLEVQSSQSTASLISRLGWVVGWIGQMVGRIHWSGGVVALVGRMSPVSRIGRLNRQFWSVPPDSLTMRRITHPHRRR